MDIYTFINFLGVQEAANTGDNINPAWLFVIFALIIATFLFFVLKSNRISSRLKKVIGISLPSVFLVLAIPFSFSSLSHADVSSSSIDAIVDPETCTAYIQNGDIINSTDEAMQLVVSSSQAVNAGLYMPGLQNAKLKVAVGDYVIFEGNPFDDYNAALNDYYILQPGQAVQYTTELTGLDKQTSLDLLGSGYSIQLRFKFYFALDGTYKITNEPVSVSDYLYEVEYETWDADKCNYICECIGKNAYYWGPDTKEYKDYLRKEWGLNEEQIQFVVQIRKYLEESDPYFPVLCTSCRVDNYIGRNFDWAYDDLNEYVVRADKTDEHYKSLGVVSSFFPQAFQDLIDIKTMLPMLTMDGINEYGVAVNINVVPPDAFGATTGTNPGHKRLCAGVIPRFVLDNAKTAREAIDLLLDRDIYTVCFSEFHFMISDANETYIVETSNNEVVVLRHTGSQGTAMSNFHVSNSEFSPDYEVIAGKTEVSETYAAHSMGIERYKKALYGLDRIGTLDDMVEHMIPIYYENVYNKWADKNFWSDKNGMNSSDPLSLHVFSYYDGPEWDNERYATFQHCQDEYNRIHAREDMYGWRNVGDELFNGVIQTVNASCYDIAKKSLALCVQERWVTFNFNLDGQFQEGATKLFVNGDNVGLAKACYVEGSCWDYDANTKTLYLNNDDCVYYLSGDATGITIKQPELVGYSVTIPKMDGAVAKVEFAPKDTANLELAKARMGVRAVPKNYYVKITFIAEDGYVFEEGGVKELVKEIPSINENVVFGTEKYPIPKTIEED